MKNFILAMVVIMAPSMSFADINLGTVVGHGVSGIFQDQASAESQAVKNGTDDAVKICSDKGGFLTTDDPIKTDCQYSQPSNGSYQASCDVSYGCAEINE